MSKKRSHKKHKQSVLEALSHITIIAIGCPTGTFFEPSGTSILARNLKSSSISQISIQKGFDSSVLKTDFMLKGIFENVPYQAGKTHTKRCLEAPKRERKSLVENLSSSSRCVSLPTKEESISKLSIVN